MTQSSPKLQLSIAAVAPGSKHLQGVCALWSVNRATLGLFPQGAFEAYASKGGIYAALSEEKQVVGYMAFRISRGWVRLVHLCVAEEWRRTGVAHQLVGKLKELSLAAGLQGITLKCRRDYEVARKTWERLGFVPRADVAGRSLDGSELTIWVCSNHLPDLFSTTATPDDDRLRAAIDANILFDLFDKWGGRNKEALVLREPWISDAVEIGVTDVIHTEIDACLRDDQRRHYHERAHDLRELLANEPETDRKFRIIQGIMGWTAPTDRQRRDMLHLAKTSVAEASIFLTRDGELLDKVDELEAELGIRIMRPAEMASWLDEAERSKLYEPARLAGTDVAFRQVRAEEIEGLCPAFQAANSGETVDQLQARLRTAVSQVRAGTCTRVAVMSEGGPLSLAIERTEENTVVLELLRFSRSRWAATLARHHLLQSILSASQSGRLTVQIIDPFLAPSTIDALRELHFVWRNNRWVRPLASFVGEWPDAKGFLAKTLVPTLGSQEEVEKVLAAFGEGRIETSRAAAAEARFWPLKVLGAGVPTYLVPIQRAWAAPLFDAELACRDLFGAPPALALNRENVYYRAVRPGRITAPARILWYVSGADEQGGTMAVRACSRLVDVDVGPAKDLFRRYHRLGIYDWKQVLSITGGEALGRIMALKFSDTEALQRRVPLRDLREIGIRSAPMSPRRLTDDQFLKIYRRGEAQLAHERCLALIP